jgi:hypothetical protein
MGYSHNLYIGWYAELTPTKEQVSVGAETVKQCSGDAKHKKMGDGKFCSICGSEIVKVQKTKMKGLSLACHFFDETDPEELAYQTIGRATAEDMKALEGSHAIFPEFMPDGPYKRERIMAPGYIYEGDIRNSDGFILDIEPGERPSKEWEAKLNKIFGCTDLKVKFGVLKEVV